MKKLINSKFYLLNSNLGYSLIELIVVLALMGIIFSFGLAAWTNYRDWRTLDEAGLELVSQLRSVRSRAVNGKKPNTGCNYLTAYEYRFDIDEDFEGVEEGFAYAFACCRNNGDESCNFVKTFEYNFPDLVAGLDNFPVRFLSGTGQTQGDSTIDLSYHDKQGEVRITNLGATIEWLRSSN